MNTTTPIPVPVAAPVPVAVVSKRQLSNGVIQICLRANDDATSDSQATFYVQDGTQIDRTTGKLIAATVAADIQAWVAQEKARVAQTYTTMTLVHAVLLAVIPK